MNLGKASFLMGMVCWLKKNFQDILEREANDRQGVWFFDATGHSIAAATNPLMFKFLPITAEQVQKLKFCIVSEGFLSATSCMVLAEKNRKGHCSKILIFVWFQAERKAFFGN